MRVLVTGGAGFIGSFVCEGLLAAGHDVRVLDNLDPQVHPDGGTPDLPPAVEFILCDVRDADACARALEGVEAIVHAAGAVGVGQSMYKVRHYVDVNVTGTATLLEALIARQSTAKLIVLTSMTGYGEGLYRRPSDGRLLRVGLRTEEDIERHGWEPVCPETREPLLPHPTPEGSNLLCRNVYAYSKRYQEELSLALGSAYGFPVVCLRLFNVYGPRQSLSNPYTGVMAIFLSRLLAGERPVIYEDGRQTRDFVSVHDVTAAVIAALGSSSADGQVVNIGSGVGRSIREIATTLAHLAGKSDLAPLITERYRLGDVRHCIADASRARLTLAFTPKMAWEDGLAEVVEWARTSPSVDRMAEAQAELESRQLLGERRTPPQSVRS